MKEKIIPDKKLINSKGGYSEHSFIENFYELKKLI